jgi:hypothetical protein
MTWNPHDPTKPGGYTDWVDHGNKYGNWGGFGDTTHKPSSSSAPTSSWTSPSNSSSISSSYGSGSPTTTIGSALASPISTISRSLGGGTGGLFDRGYRSGTFRQKVGRTIGLLFCAAILFGAYDNWAHQSTPGESYTSASAPVSKLSHDLATWITGLNPNYSELLSVVSRAELCAGVVSAVSAGVGASIGNLAHSPVPQ